jgi:hypothetical protein
MSTYIRRINPDKAASRKRKKVTVLMVAHVSFLFVLIPISAGICHVVLAAYVDFDDIATTKNLFLAGTVGWGILSWNVIVEAYKAAGRRFDLRQENKFRLKEAIVEASPTGDAETERNIRISEVVAAIAPSSRSKQAALHGDLSSTLSAQSSRLLTELSSTSVLSELSSRSVLTGPSSTKSLLDTETSFRKA